MKRLLPLLTLAAACLVLAPAVLAPAVWACPGPPVGPHTFACMGEVTAADVDAGLLTVAVQPSPYELHELHGTLTITITSHTKLFSLAAGHKTAITLADIAVGDQVAVSGTVDKSSGTAVYTARVVCVLVCPAPDVHRFACTGEVTAVDADAGLLTVDVEHGCHQLNGTVTITITGDTKLFSVAYDQKTAITLADIVVGDHVAVSGTLDKGSGTAVYTAREVCVRVSPEPDVHLFACVGSVSAVDATGGLLTVDLRHGSHELNGTLTIAVTSDTRLFSLADHQKAAITLADIAVGDHVAVLGTADESSGTAVYSAAVVLDGAAKGSLPLPLCKPAPLKVKASDAHRGDKLKVRLKIRDKMPGCHTAKVRLTVTTMGGRKLTSVTVRGVTVNKRTTVTYELRKTLRRGNYRIRARAIDWAGNKQAKAASAKLKVR